VPDAAGAAGGDDPARRVREWDRARYYATLFAPADLRADLIALFAFAAEIAGIPDRVSEPTIGEIRLQFWRDALDGLRRGETNPGPPVLAALAQVIARRRLPTEPLIAVVEARRADLYADPPPTLTDLEGFFGETQSALFQLAAVVAGAAGPETADLSGHAGVAYGLARRLAGFAVERARGRTVVPAQILAAEGLAAADIFAPEPPEALLRALAQLIGQARRHLAAAQKLRAGLPPAIRPVYLPVAVVEPTLRRLERAGPALIGEPVHLSDFETLARISGAAVSGRLRPRG